MADLDLEDLLNDLSADLRPAPSKAQPSASAKASAKPAPKTAPAPVSSASSSRKPAAAAHSPSVGDDLEALMADLSGGRAQSVAAPANADELEMLMEDLASPSKPRLAPSASASSSRTPQPQAQPKAHAHGAGQNDDELDGFEEVLDDDALDGILSDLAPSASKAPAPGPSKQPPQQQPKPSQPTATAKVNAKPNASSARPAASAEPASVDDGLEALLGDLSNIPPPKPVSEKKSTPPPVRATAAKANDSALDALMADLAGPAPRVPSAPSAAASQGSELESLMAELSSPTPQTQTSTSASASGAKAKVPAPKASDGELDALMADLAAGSNPTSPAAARAKADASLLGDLTRGSVVPAHPLQGTVHVQRPQTSEIDRLMNDLNSVSAPQSTSELDMMMEAMRGNPNPMSPSPSSSAGRVTVGPSQADLNALMNALGDGNRPSAYAPQMMAYAPPPVASAPSTNNGNNNTNNNNNKQKRRSQAPSNSELDALMTSLKAQPSPNAQGARSVPGAELEVLMADLNAAKGQGPQRGGAPTAGARGGGGGGGGDLDAMLANLSSSGGPAPPRLPAPGPRLPHGICSGCRKFIAGEMVQAMGRCYHPEHFTCTACSRHIGATSYFEQDSQPLCATCYHKHFSPPCARCGEPIAQQLLTALGKRWHPDCFVCCSCQSPFPGGQFFERAQQPYCPACYQNPRAGPAPVQVAALPSAQSSSAARCRGCGQGVVVAQALQALEALWHPEHFVCATCKRPFVNGQFYELGGQPVCPADYQKASQGRK